MSTTQFSVNISGKIPEASSYLKLEQEPWSDNVGKMSTTRGMLVIAAAANGGLFPEVFCGGLNGTFNATVHVYPYPAELPFTLKVSHGHVASRFMALPIREETIQCGFQTELSPEYPVHVWGGVQWVGNCYDRNGNIVPRPTVTRVGNILKLSEQVYGSIRIRYTVVRHTYTISISSRTDAIENKYQSVAYAVFDGGVVWLDVTAPAGFEEFDGDCGNGAFYDDSLLPDGYTDGQLSQTTLCSTRYTRYPIAARADKEVEVDYCTQEVISEKISASTADYEMREWQDCISN